MRTRLGSARGQSIVEFAFILPLCVLLVLGVVETSYALLDQHVVTKLTREGSNLISRNTTLVDAADAMTNMTTRPVNFGDGSSTLIFSVIRRGSTTGTANYDRLIVYQRHQRGTFPAASKLVTRGTLGPSSFGGAPNYEAVNSDSNVNLQITNIPANLVPVPGGMLYVTEVFTRHPLLTPLDRFGVQLPSSLYSIAYF